MAKGIVKYRTGEELEPIAQAITSMGQVASKEDKTIGLAEKVKKISTDATATPTQILSGQTAYVNGQKITGTMPNRGANNIVLPVNGTATIPEGYHNGQGRVTQNLVTQGGYTNPISSWGTNPAFIRIPQGYYGTNTVSGYPEIVYSLDMARSSGYALQSEVDHWRNSYYGMEQDRNNWINVANSRINYSYISKEIYNKTSGFLGSFTLPFSKMIQLDIGLGQCDGQEQLEGIVLVKKNTKVETITINAQRVYTFVSNSITDHTGYKMGLVSGGNNMNIFGIDYNVLNVWNYDSTYKSCNIAFSISSSGITISNISSVWFKSYSDTKLFLNARLL